MELKGPATFFYNNLPQSFLRENYNQKLPWKHKRCVFEFNKYTKLVALLIAIKKKKQTSYDKSNFLLKKDSKKKERRVDLIRTDGKRR
jgi:hypothetical protein